MANKSASAGQQKTTSSAVMTNASGARTAKTYPRVRFLPNGLLDVDRRRGKFFKMVQENQQASPFLQLPAEIRSAIYEYALGDETFKIKSDLQVSDKEERKKKAYLALLQVSRQVYVETALIPFKVNAFHANHPQTLRAWAGLIPIIAQQTITRIHLSAHFHWHAYLSFADGETHRANPLPAWWKGSGNFDGFPALRQICILTILTQCYCDKAKSARDALAKFVGDSEEELKKSIKSSHKGTTASNSLDIVFQRDLNFAPIRSSLEVSDDEGENVLDS